MTLMAQSIGALAVVLAIFAGLVWGLRRLQGVTLSKAESHMQVVQRLHLDSKNSVVEIKHGSKHYLLGVGQGGVQKIADVCGEDAFQAVVAEEVVKDDA